MLKVPALASIIRFILLSHSLIRKEPTLGAAAFAFLVLRRRPEHSEVIPLRSLATIVSIGSASPTSGTENRSNPVAFMSTKSHMIIKTVSPDYHL